MWLFSLSRQRRRCSTSKMIGMMNSGGGGSDQPVEFYSTPRGKGKSKERLYKPVHKTVISYTEEGRKTVDGQIVGENPDELWQELIMRVVWYMLCKDHLQVKEYKMPKGKNFISNFFKVKKSKTPKSGAKPGSKVDTTPAPEFNSSPPSSANNESRSFTSFFLRKQKFCAQPHQMRVVGRSP